MAEDEASLVELVQALRAEVAALRGRVAELEEENRQLHEENRQLREENRRLERENSRLRKKVEKLQRKLDQRDRDAKRQAAPFRKKSKPPGSGRKPGRDEGHPPAKREATRQPDREVELPLGGCPECGCLELKRRKVSEQLVEDLPEPRSVLTRYRIETAYCPCCNKRVRNRSPDQVSDAGGAAKVQLGGGVLGLVGYLRHRLGVSLAHCATLLRERYDMRVSRAGLLKADARLGQRLTGAFAEVLDHVRHAAVVHADETGWPHAGKNFWLWAFATSDAALVRIRDSRGSEVARGVLMPGGRELGGTLVSDGWSAYDALALDPAKRQQCLAHLIRRAADLEEQQLGAAKRFPRAVLEALRDALAVRTWQPHLPAAEYFELCEWVGSKLAAILNSRLTSPANRRLQRFLSKHRDSLLTFLRSPEVPATNNEAERAIRPMILPRKTTGGTRSPEGLATHETTATIIETCHRQRLPILAFLTATYQRQHPTLNLR